MKSGHRYKDKESYFYSNHDFLKFGQKEDCVRYAFDTIECPIFKDVSLELMLKF